MIELLYMTLILFGPLLILFFIFPEFKEMKLFLIFCQFIFSIIQLSDNFYRDHILYEKPNFEYIQNLDFKPINYLYRTSYPDEYGNSETIKYNTMSTSKFSLIKTEKYATKCLDNFYIEPSESCPITDIILGDSNNRIYQNYISINTNEYIYYTKNKLGKLYRTFNYTSLKENKEDFYPLDKTIRKENYKLSNPIYNFKLYIKFCDVFCLLLIIYSFWCTFFESLNYQECDLFKIVNKGVQLVIIILQFIRFIKFVEIKQFFFDNEDIYDTKTENYFPNKALNIDSVLLAFSINLFIYNFLSARFPGKNSFCGPMNEFDCDLKIKSDPEKIALILIIPLYLTYFVLAIFDTLNDEKISDDYNKLIYNWNLSPFKSIKETSNPTSYDYYDYYDDYYYSNNRYSSDSSSNYFSLGNDYLRLEKLNSYDYISIFPNKYGKICGKDSFGNNLYFPNYTDCPINKIYISFYDENIPGYRKLSLKKGKYLYYTNESIDGNIITDLRISYASKIDLNPRYTKDLTNIPFYEEIYSNFSGDNSNLYAINYLGINTSSISGDKIENFEKKIKIYKSLSKGKLALFCLYNIFIVFFIILFCLSEKDKLSNSVFEVLFGILIICFIIIYLLYFIFLSICLDIHIKYITNFMNKINLDFERQKNDFKWNLIILIYQIIFLAIPIIMLFISTFYKGYSNENRNSSYHSNIESSNDIVIYNNKKKIQKLNEEIKEKDKKIELLNNKILNMENNFNTQLTLNKNDQENYRLKQEMEILKKKNTEIIQSSHNALDLITKKDKEIDILKSSIPFDIKEGEKIMLVIFQCVDDQSVHYPFLCTNKQIFNIVENKLYEKEPKYKETDNYFIVNSNMIVKTKSLEENNIKDGDIILMFINELNK